MLHKILCEVINPRSGVIQQDTDNSHIVLDITWKGDFHFIVSDSGLYYVERNKQPISTLYYFHKIDAKLFIHMQHVINEIESGKYRNKKTLSEKILSTVKEKGLVSYMNDTKWRELINAIKQQLPDIPIQYKTIFQNDSPDVYWTLAGDEFFGHMNMAQIEWIKIKHIITDTIWIGQLVAPKFQTYDKKEELIQIFQTYHLPYEYHTEEQCFIIYGYK